MGPLAAFLRRRVVAAFVKRVAFDDPDDGVISADQETSILDCFQCILAARWCEPAPRWKKRADPDLVEPNQPCHEFCKQAHANRR